MLTSNPYVKRLETMLCIYMWSMVKVDISMFKPGEWSYMVGECLTLINPAQSLQKKMDGCPVAQLGEYTSHDKRWFESTQGNFSLRI